MKRRLTKSSTDRVIDGVAGGIAEYFDVDPVLVRLVFLLLFLSSGGVLIVAYVLLMIVMPSETQVDQDPREAVRENIETMGQRLRQAGEDIGEEFRDFGDELRGEGREQTGGPGPLPEGVEPGASSGSGTSGGMPFASVGDADAIGDDPDAATEAGASSPTGSPGPGEMAAGYAGTSVAEEPWQAEVRRRAESATQDVAPTPRRHRKPADRSRQLGILLILLGAAFLTTNMIHISTDALAALAVIAIGVYVLLRRGG